MNQDALSLSCFKPIAIATKLSICGLYLRRRWKRDLYEGLDLDSTMSSPRTGILSLISFNSGIVGHFPNTPGTCPALSLVNYIKELLSLEEFRIEETYFPTVLTQLPLALTGLNPGL